ncbi:MAG: DUF4215 domain-containing protein [Myxococcota bacterium]|nr:DUF4215 domain-containing protein [Myxococcota bacterium]
MRAIYFFGLLLLVSCGEETSSDPQRALDRGVPDQSIADANTTPDAQAAPVCGDGRLQRGESCDDGNLINEDGCDRNCTITGCGNGVVTGNEGCDDGNQIDGDGCDSNCRPTACGNGIQTEREQCDDGNRSNGDGCDENCTLSACGNGILSGDEACDDGNLDDADGCDSNCTTTACGNGVLTRGEACDDGNLVDGDGCDSNCRPTGCGNGAISDGESCDDGNQVDGDGCDSNCQPTGCGNDLISVGEACDDGNEIDGDGCDSNCTPTGCGNGILTEGELCDDGDLIDGDGCDSNCTHTGCQNGVITNGEDCDDGNADNGDGCDENCTLTGCGNGVTTDDEICDDGNLLSGDGCDNNCTQTACGNAVVTDPEECDDGNQIDGDGCDNDCSVTGCGNGIQTADEVCDDGNDVDGDGCDTNCTLSACSNGIIAPEEECDDGNLVPGDGCEPDCTRTPTCDDSRQNGAETDVDCGGPDCLPCSAGRLCRGGNDCASQICSRGLCGNASCYDGILNGSEGDVDCGGESGLAQRVELGGATTCIGLVGGNLRCLGANDVGQLGLGDTESRGMIPQHLGDALQSGVPDDFGPVSDYTLSNSVRCVLSIDGQILCSGAHRAFAPELDFEADAFTGDQANEVGRAGTRFESPDDPVVQVDAGLDFICARTRGGAIFCWGQNEFGQLGRATDEAAASFQLDTPVDLGPGQVATDLAVGGHTACAIMSDDRLKCWGRNDKGQLGLRQRDNVGLEPNSMGENLAAVDLGTGRYARQISVGSKFTCAVLDDASAKCWGANDRGQLGQGAAWFSHGTGRAHMGDNLPPISLINDASIASISAGHQHACAVTGNGRGICWGGNDNGQLGMGDQFDRGRAEIELAELTGIDMPSDLGVLHMSAGGEHSCAVLFDKQVLCWGANGSGQLGQGHRESVGSDPDQPVVAASSVPLGRNCPKCATGAVCTERDQCESQICRGGTCREPGCFDGIQNALETDSDCGGSDCPACPLGFSCLAHSDCMSGNCEPVVGDNGAGRCGAARCDDGLQNAAETDIDCGGPACDPCADRQSCQEQSDCASERCVDGLCISCADGVLNGSEVALDCGGPECAGCQDGLPCQEASDCESQLCADGLCISCRDGQINGAETATDCGGPSCLGCPDGQPCQLNSDCASNQCANGQCISCTDGLLNGDEAQIDCGGATCPGCRPGAGCQRAIDCSSLRCENTVCAPSTCFDGIQNGTEGDLDCGASLAVVTDVALGLDHSCVLLAGGRVKCFGANDRGQLGYDDRLTRSAREQLGDSLFPVPLPESARALAAGHGSSCAVTRSGRVYCWGDNRNGQLGRGDNRPDVGGTAGDMANVLQPVQLPAETSISSLCMGQAHVCALSERGDVFCWGQNSRGQLGYDDRTTRGLTSETMASVGPLMLGQPVEQIACGDLFSCGRLSDGSVKCWGDSASGQIGQGRSFPLGDDPGEMATLPVVELGDGRHVLGLTAGAKHACALLDDQSVKCWGQAAFGALGIPGDANVGDNPGEMGNALPSIAFRPGFIPRTIHAGDGTSCVLGEDAQAVYCWGQSGRYGTVGIENPTPIIRFSLDSPPVQLAAPGPLYKLVLGEHHACVITEERTLHCWGWNEAGQLGRGDRITIGRSLGDMDATAIPSSLGRGCLACADGLSCTESSQCESNVCQNGQCAAIGCGDGVINGSETDTDCGGDTCGPCGPSAACLIDQDCQQGRCRAGVCSTCGDDARNGFETGVDCGGRDCGPCPNGATCVESMDCLSFACIDGSCRPRSCDDGIANGPETDVDCGGDECDGCRDGLLCQMDADCGSNQCRANVCTSCDDGIQNAGETGVDCGGPDCSPCDADGACLVDSDCNSRICQAGFCRLESCNDGIKNGEEGDVDCGGTTPIRGLGLGAEHSCVVFANGRVKCVGSNARGKLGLGDDVMRGDDPLFMGQALPSVALAENTSIMDVGAGWNHSCALTSTGRIACWGGNTFGQLGLGDNRDRGALAEDIIQPFSFVDLNERHVVQLAVGGNHNCVLFDDGQVSCWGANSRGQLGLGDQENRGDSMDETGPNLRTVSLGLGVTAIAISAGAEHSCAHLDDNTVKCWGRGDSGQLGLGTDDDRGDNPNEMGDNLPVVRHSLASEIVLLGTGAAHTCILNDEGMAMCWGLNTSGQLGIDHSRNIGDDPIELGPALDPVLIDEPMDSLALGSAHTCALLRRGRIQCWGANFDGQLGLGQDLSHVGRAVDDMSNLSRVVNLGQGTKVIDIAVGDNHTCALISDRTLRCFGHNQFGQLGLGDQANRGRAEDEMGLGLGMPDFGRQCDQCDVGRSCDRDVQCRTLTCSDNGRCAFLGCDQPDCPTCWDGRVNGLETDVDCGGDVCQACAVGQRCEFNLDCDSRLCDGGRCVSCTDGVQNGRETDVDCGGVDCQPCGQDRRCENNRDCAFGRCSMNMCTAN